MLFLFDESNMSRFTAILKSSPLSVSLHKQDRFVCIPITNALQRESINIYRRLPTVLIIDKYTGYINGTKLVEAFIPNNRSKLKNSKNEDADLNCQKQLNIILNSQYVKILSSEIDAELNARTADASLPNFDRNENCALSTYVLNSKKVNKNELNDVDDMLLVTGTYIHPKLLLPTLLFINPLLSEQLTQLMLSIFVRQLYDKDISLTSDVEQNMQLNEDSKHKFENIMLTTNGLTNETEINKIRQDQESKLCLACGVDEDSYNDSEGDGEDDGGHDAVDYDGEEEDDGKLDNDMDSYEHISVDNSASLSEDEHRDVELYCDPLLMNKLAIDELVNTVRFKNTFYQLNAKLIDKNDKHTEKSSKKGKYTDQESLRLSRRISKYSTLLLIRYNDEEQYFSDSQCARLLYKYCYDFEFEDMKKRYNVPSRIVEQDAAAAGKVKYDVEICMSIGLIESPPQNLFELLMDQYEDQIDMTIEKQFGEKFLCTTELDAVKQAISEIIGNYMNW